MRRRRHIIPAKTYRQLLFAAIVLFALCGAVAARGVIPAWEKSLFLSIYNFPTWLTPVMVFITFFGSSWFFALSVMVAAARQHKALAVELFVTGGLVFIVIQICKLIFERLRPFQLLDNVTNRDLITQGFGFPSGHTAMATILSLTLFAYMPRRLWWVPLSWIFLVGFSRIYLGQHAPLDVLGGFAIGVAIICGQQLFLGVYKTRLKRL